MQFLGHEVSYRDARALVIPVPYEATTTYLKGTQKGPEAIIKASCNVEEFILELGQEIREIYTEEPVPCSSFEELSATIPSFVSRALEGSKFPVFLGGEHSITPPIVSAMKKSYPSLKLLHIDAHADMRFEYEGRKDSHACAMRRVHELGVETVSIGIRAISWEEDEYIKGKGILVYGPEFNPAEALSKLEGPLYISLDFDALDPSVIPDVGTPEPGGIGYYQLLSFLKEVFYNFDVVGMDAVELLPLSSYGPFAAARIIHNCIGYSLTASFK
ncbi:MAG: agmatinase [Candidatus Anstonellales archaeon]